MKEKIILICLILNMKSFSQNSNVVNFLEVEKKPEFAIESNCITGNYAIKHENEYALYQSNGKIIGKLPYQKIERFYQGLAAFNQNGKWGFLDTTFQVCIQPEFETIFGFEENKKYASKIPINGFSSNGSAFVRKKDGLFAMIDKKGKTLTQFKYDYIFPFNEGYARFINGGRSSGSIFAEPLYGGEYGFIDIKGKEYLIGRQWQIVSDIHQGLARVVNENKKCGFIDIQNNIIVPAKYDYASDFKYGRAVVCEGDFWSIDGVCQWGFIDKYGNKINKVQYSFVDDFRNNVSFVNIGGRGRTIGLVRGGKWGIVDTTGNEILPVEFDKITLGNNVYITYLNDRCIIYDLLGKKVASFLIGENKHFFYLNGIFIVNGKKGCVSNMGEDLIPCSYEDLSHLFGNYYKAKIGNKWGIIDSKNIKMTEFIYDEIGNKQYAIQKDIVWYSKSIQSHDDIFDCYCIYFEVRKNGKLIYLFVEK